MIETDPRLLQGRSTAPPQISVSVAGTQTECSPSQEPANQKADLARLQSAVAELLCTMNIRRRGNRTLSEQRIWIAAEQVEFELRDVVAETPVLPTQGHRFEAVFRSGECARHAISSTRI